MAEVRIPVDAFENGRLPAVCVVTGEVADGAVECQFDVPIGAKWLLVFFGLIPFVIVWAVTRKPARGDVPVSEAAFGRVRTEQAASRKKGNIGVAVFLVGIVAASVVSSWNGVLGLLVAMASIGFWIWSFRGGASVTVVPGHVEASGRWLVLTDVAPAFADAVRRDAA